MNIILMVNLLTDLVRQDSVTKESGKGAGATGDERAEAAKEQANEEEAAGKKLAPQ